MKRRVPLYTLRGWLPQDGRSTPSSFLEVGLSLTSTFRKYLLPGFVFQSVVIAGGYGTGRELVEFFLTEGPLGGLLAMLLVSTVIWSAVCAASFEFARCFRAYDYRTFFKNLLGPAWPAFEICYALLVLVILAVIAAAAGAILRDTFSFNYGVGVVGMIGAIGFLVFRGSKTIERFLAGWSLLLYVVYFLFFVLAFVYFGESSLASLTSGEIRGSWPIAGVRYAGYNLAVIPAVLFCTRYMESRKEAVSAGILAGPIAIVPGLLFYLSMIGHYPEILAQDVPASFLLESIGSRSFQIVFQVVLFGTLIETGTGLIHAVNERISNVFEERDRKMPVIVRPIAATLLLVLAAAMAQLGLTDLIAQGYGKLTWAFICIFVIPILTWGIWKTIRHEVE